MKRLLPALLIAASLSFATAPADAGPLRDALRKTAEKVALKGLCVIDRASSGSKFFCKK